MLQSMDDSKELAVWSSPGGGDELSVRPSDMITLAGEAFRREAELVENVF